ncbi:MAG: AAA family ATPase [Patescibacteria group bacterium]
MITIGLTGTIGAGKGTIVEYLKTQGFTHYPARDFLIREVVKRGLEPIRENITVVANDLRKIHSPDYIISELSKERATNPGNAIIESIRNLGEIDYLRKTIPNFYLFAVDADLKLRYERILERGLSTDHISFEQFVIDENKEMDSKELWKQNIRACISQADFVFENNGTIEELSVKVEEVLKNLTNK